MPAIQWQTVDSSNIHSVAHNSERERMAVRFKNGGHYIYSGVNNDIFFGMVGGQSAGKYLASVVKVMCPYERYETEADLTAAFFS